MSSQSKINMHSHDQTLPMGIASTSPSMTTVTMMSSSLHNNNSESSHHSQKKPLQPSLKSPNSIKESSSGSNGLKMNSGGKANSTKSRKSIIISTNQSGEEIAKRIMSLFDDSQTSISEKREVLIDHDQNELPNVLNARLIIREKRHKSGEDHHRPCTNLSVN